MNFVQPRWTVLFNSNGDEDWTSRNRVFFTSYVNASSRHLEEVNKGTTPTLRPFHMIEDQKYLSLKHRNTLCKEYVELTSHPAEWDPNG